MISSILFDLMGVLMRFDTEGYYRIHDVAPTDRDIIQREVFRSLEWSMQDRGTISEEDAAASICGRIPARLHAVARDFLYRRNRAILPVPGMIDLLADLKAAGFRLYILSNTSVAYRRFRSEIPGIRYFDDMLISADVGLVKPDPEIFRLACRRFDIIPSESAFVDDTPINAEAAHYIGMRALVFNDDVNKLRFMLQQAGINI